MLEEKEPTEEQLEKFLEVKISQGATWEDIKRSIEGRAFLRFVVTKDFDVYISSSHNTHDEILDDNGLMFNDCIIPNGALWEDDNGGLRFSYQATPTTVFNHAAEKKIIKFFETRGIKFRHD